MAKLGKLHQQGFARWVVTWDTEMVITRIPGHPPGPEFGQHHRTICPKVLPHPKGVKID